MNNIGKEENEIFPIGWFYTPSLEKQNNYPTSIHYFGCDSVGRIWAHSENECSCFREFVIGDRRRRLDKMKRLTPAAFSSPELGCFENRKERQEIEASSVHDLYKIW